MAASMLATPYAERWGRDAEVESDLADFAPILNRLRFLAQGCRAQARLDLAEACQVIHVDQSKSLDAMATAMIRVMSHAVSGRVTFLAPGARAMSFDEEWLMRVLDRARDHDTASVEFLLRRRVARQHHHAFRAIIRAVAALLRE